jgi:uncharacterized protein (TIGR03437 family)
VNLSLMGRIVVRLAAMALLFTPVLSMAQVKVPAGTITTIAGDQSLGNDGYTGDGGPALSAQLNLPVQAVFVGGNLYIADQFNEAVRYVTGATGIITTIAGDGTAGYTKDGVAANTSELSSPCGVWVDGSGNLYIADTTNNLIRMVTAAKGIISTVAGTPGATGYLGDGLGALSAELSKPSSVVFDSSGNMYIADSGNNVIRKVTASTAANPNVISTYAGVYNSGMGGYTGDNGQAGRAELSDPVALALDAAGNLYIADSNNDVIRKVTATSGIITTIAGNGTQGFSGDGGRAVLAQLSHPKGVAVDSAGNVYISDTFNSRIRVVAPNGTISTVVGTGVPGYSGDGGPATAAQLDFPANLSFDTAGNLYIADNNNNVIRQYAPPSAASGSLPVINSGGVISASSFGALSAIAPGSWIEIYGSNLANTTANWNNSFTGVNAPTALGNTTVTIGGLSAFIDYVSSGQVNAQVPSGVGSGPQQLVVATAVGQSAAYTVTVNGTEPGLWAPAMFQVGGKQYVGGQLSDGSWALPTGAVAGYTSRPANPGETITMYGVGFGPVNTAVPAGQIVSGLNSLTTPLTMDFGSAQVTLSYYGLAPELVGVYQFNAVVPSIAASNAVPVTFVLGSSNNAQTLYTAVQ